MLDMRKFRCCLIAAGACMCVAAVVPGTAGANIHRTKVARKHKTKTQKPQLVVVKCAAAVICQGTKPGPQGNPGTPGKNGVDGKNGANGTPGKDGAPGAAATTDWAVINGDGSIIRGSNVIGGDQRTTGSGIYAIFFNIPVDGCSYAATIRDPGKGFITAESGIAPDPSPDTVVVKTYSTAGAAVDLPFSLQVFC